MLTNEQLALFRERLEQQRTALRLQIASVQRQLADPELIVDAIGNQGDDGNMLFAREQAMDELAQLEQTSAQVELALQHLEDGTYGYSAVSGHPIPIERLQALPYATTLVGEHRQEYQDLSKDNHDGK